MLPSQSIRLLLQSTVSPVPIAAVTVISSRGLLKHAAVPEIASRNPKNSTKISPTPRTQPKSTLSLHSPTIAIPDSPNIYRPQTTKEAPPPEPEQDAPDSVSVPNTYTIPKAKNIPEILPGMDPFSNAHLPKLDLNRFRQSSPNNPLLPYSFPRKVKTKTLSNYMQLLSPVEKEESSVEKKEKPLVLVYPWLMAKEKHVEKYTRLYTDLGIDVLRVNITPHDLMRPVPRSHVAAVQVLDYLLENQQWNKLLLHGLSVGAYGFMEVMTKMEENEDKYLEGIRPRFLGQVWDSPCDLPGLKEGVSRSISSNRNVQLKIMDFLEWILHVRYEAATRHYIKTQDMYYKNYLDTSSLFLYSRADRVASPRLVTDVANYYHSVGYQVFSKVFDESPHVGHFPRYKDEYKCRVMAFIHHIGLLEHAGIHID